MSYRLRRSDLEHSATRLLLSIDREPLVQVQVQEAQVVSERNARYRFTAVSQVPGMYQPQLDPVYLVCFDQERRKLCAGGGGSP